MLRCFYPYYSILGTVTVPYVLPLQCWIIIFSQQAADDHVAEDAATESETLNGVKTEEPEANTDVSKSNGDIHAAEPKVEALQPEKEKIAVKSEVGTADTVALMKQTLKLAYIIQVPYRYRTL